MDEREKLVEMLSRYEVAVFDLDGTLVDLQADWEGMKKALREHVKQKLQKDMIFSPLDETLESVRAEFGAETYQQLLEIVADFEWQPKRQRPNNELLQYINQASQSQKIVIYSMNTQRTIDAAIGKYFRRKPDLVISKQSCLEPKPTDKDLLALMKSWNLRSKDIIYVGNSDSDRQSGEKANVKTVIINMI